MAINKYDSPAQDRYTNTYVPLPYGEIMGAVAARQAQLQQEQDMLNKTYEDTQNLKYIPGSKDEQYVRDYLGKTGDIVNKYYGQDLSDPIVKQQMRREFNTITNKQNIQNIQMSHDAWAANQKYKAQLKAEGLYDPLIDEDPASQWDTVGSGRVYDNITSPYKNPRPAAETYFNNIKATDLGASGDYLYSGVTDDKIKEVANAKWGEFANTSEGNLYVKKIAKERGLDYTDPNIRRDIATEYLMGVGKEFTYRDRGNPTLDAQVRAARSKKDETSEYNNTTLDQPIRVTDSFDPLKVGKLQFSKEGKLLTSPTSGGFTAGTAGLSGGSFVKQSTYEDKEALERQATQKLDLVRQKLPQLKGLSDAETYKAYRELTQDGRALPDLPLVELPGVPRDKLASVLANSMLNRQLMVMDEFGSSDLRASTDASQGSALKDLGYTTQSLKKELALAANHSDKATVSIGGLAQNGPMAGMLQIEVPDRSKKGGGKGQLRKLYISTNDQTKAIMAPTNDVYNNITNFQGGITPLGKDANGRVIAVEVVPNIQKDPHSGKWVYDYEINQGYLGPDNKLTTDDPLHPNGIPTSIQEIGNMQLKRLRNSGYLNSEVNFTNENTAPSF
jgi:hypothetical protein